MNIAEKIIDKDSKPDRAPKQGKDDFLIQSRNQANPSLARPEDFQPISEEVEFSGHCGDTSEEYDQLLKAGPLGH